MKRKLACLSMAVMLGLVTGCRHKAVTAPVPPVPQPLPQPQAGMGDLPQVPATSTPNVQLSLPGTTETAPVHKRRTHPARRRREESEASNTQEQKQPAATDSNAGQEPSDATPIGRLSTAPAATDSRDSASIQTEINSIRSGAHNIHRALSRSEQQTVTEIETFLDKAQNALQTGDMDGAHTLTVKARVLLNELNH